MRLLQAVLCCGTVLGAMLGAVLGIAQGAGEDVVHIRSKYTSPPLITSSTLRWVKKSMGERSEAAVVGAYEIVPGECDLHPHPWNILSKTFTTF